MSSADVDATSTADVVLSTVDDGVAVITLNRPARHNSLDLATVTACTAALLAAYEDDAVRAIVLTGAGTVFCAGGDVSGIGKELTSEMAKDFVLRHVYGISRALALIDKPVIAALNGPALGAGLDIALLCDLRFIAADAWVQEAYVRVGVPPGDGGAWLLPRLIGTSRALDILWTGRRVSAEEALRIGLVDRSVPSATLLSEATGYAQQLARGPQLAMRMTKRMVIQGLEMGLTAHIDQVSSHMAIIRESADFAEGLAAFRERREPRFG
jgi:enoyl-CoA hydratase/carnithine racemase